MGTTKLYTDLFELFPPPRPGRASNMFWIRKNWSFDQLYYFSC